MNINASNACSSARRPIEKQEILDEGLERIWDRVASVHLAVGLLDDLGKRHGAADVSRRG